MEKNIIESEDINLFNVINEINVNLYKIFALTILLSTIIVAFIFNFYERNYSISFEINKISALEERKYDPLNKSSILKKYNIASIEPLINADMLLEETIIEIKNNFIKVYLLYYSDYIDDINIDMRNEIAELAAKSLKVKKSKNDDFYSIIYNSKYPLESDTFILSLFDTSHVNVADKVLGYVFDLKSNIEFNKKFEIKELQSKIDAAKFKYHLDLEQKKANLIEQAQIAREIGIEVGDFTYASTNMNIFGSEELLTDRQKEMENNLPLYLRGYKAIEKEISIIEDKLSRTNLEMYIDEIPDLQAKIIMLSDTSDLKLFQEVVDKTPIGKKDFLASSFKSFNGIISSSPSVIMLSALSIILSFFGSIMLILFLSSYKRYSLK